MAEGAIYAISIYQFAFCDSRKFSLWILNSKCVLNFFFSEIFGGQSCFFFFFKWGSLFLLFSGLPRAKSLYMFYRLRCFSQNEVSTMSRGRDEYMKCFGSKELFVNIYSE